MNIYKSLGLEWLLEKEVSDSLNEHITQNTRYMVPGYEYNYRLCTFPCHVEFQRCELLDGTVIKTDMHFCADYEWELEVQDKIKEDITTPIYAFKSKSGNTISARIICQDILPSIESGDMIRGQVVAYADSVLKTSDKSTGDMIVTDVGENRVAINGRIIGVRPRSFEFCENICDFFEIDVDTEDGDITVLVSEKNIDFTPECDDMITAYAMISMDVAVRHEDKTDEAFYKEPYIDIIEDAEEVKYRNGFKLGFHNNQKVLKNCIFTGELSRVSRCCAETISFVSKAGEKSIIIDREGIIDELKFALPYEIGKVEIKHILSCDDEKYVGHDGIVISSVNGTELIVWFDIDENRRINELAFLDPNACTTGIDYELHLQTMYAHGLCDGKWYILYEYLADGCMYRSEYSDICLVGSENIMRRFADINGRLSATDIYSYKLALSKDELIELEDLPNVYRGERCAIFYFRGELAYVVFLMLNEEHKICNILMGRNSNYLRRFISQADVSDAEQTEIKSVVDILSSAYGNENTIEAMRCGDIPQVDTEGVYVWKKADEFATAWLRENGYKVLKSTLVDDCIGYACRRKRVEYAVFFYAYGEKKTTLLDGDYCSKLRNEEIAQGREVIIIYLHVTKRNNDEGIVEYTVGSYGSEEHKIEPWLLTTANGKNILRFYPRKEMMDLIPRLISAYNTKNLDALKVLCEKKATLETFEREGCSVNDGFYSHLSAIRENYGKMKLAYIRFTDVVYSAVPYIENYAYVSFGASNKINSIKMNPLNDLYRDLIIIEDDMDYCQGNIVPSLSSVEFLDPSDIARFSIRLTFENGEIKIYNLKGDFGKDEVVKYDKKILTDKIFANGRITEHIPMPDWSGYRNYMKRGQGIEFISGSAISVEELYHNSYPIGFFSYEDIEDVHMFNEADDGFGVGRICDMDPLNPYYLFDENTMTAKTIPYKYNQTPMGIYPFYGGYSEGLVMVSEIEKPYLQYHHNRSSCAGLWGWLDKDMNIVIKPQYIYALNFVDGKAIVCKGEWKIETTGDGKEKYWCDDEKWGVIDKSGKEIVPCCFDELYEIENTDKLYFVHEGGWENGKYAIFDTDSRETILVLDFDFDMGYMFNECFVTDENVLIFDEHIPGEEKDVIYAYDLIVDKYIVHGELLEGRTYNGETKYVVNKDGKDIIIF